MTTLAFDGRRIAIDSQVTAGDLRFTEEKFYRVTGTTGDDLVVFGAGDVSDIQRAVRELAEGEELTEGNYELVVVGLQAEPVAFSGRSDPVALRGYHVAGSGAQAALAALNAGLNATEAVLTACRVDLYSGPPVHTYDLKLKRFLRLRRK